MVPPDMHCAGAQALFRSPRDRAIKRIVGLEDTRTVAVAGQGLPVARGELFARYLNKLTR